MVTAEKIITIRVPNDFALNIHLRNRFTLLCHTIKIIVFLPQSQMLHYIGFMNFILRELILNLEE